MFRVLIRQLDAGQPKADLHAIQVYVRPLATRMQMEGRRRPYFEGPENLIVIFLSTLPLQVAGPQPAQGANMNGKVRVRYMELLFLHVAGSECSVSEGGRYEYDAI
jgi:hypothetical protein